MTKDKALKLALEALETLMLERGSIYDQAITAIREALAQQEPVAITITGKLGNIYSFTGDYSLKKGDKVYTTPPSNSLNSIKSSNTLDAQRTWVGLTDEEVFDVWLNEMPAPDKVFYQKLCRSVEAKLKEKNT